MSNSPLKTNISTRCISSLLGLAALVLAATRLCAQEQPAIPTYPVPPQGFDQAREGIEKGKVETVSYDSKTVGASRSMLVYTPPGYSKDKKYPVFFLLPGAGQNERTWTEANNGRANIILDNLIADKKIEPMIVVFPNGNMGGGTRGGRGPRGVTAGESNAAPAAPGAPAGGGAPRRGGAGGGFGDFAGDLIKDIIPYVESHYSVIADAQHRALAGLSLGGMQTKAIAPAHSDSIAYFGVFSGGNISPTVDITDMETFKKNTKLVFMSFGSREPSAPRGTSGLPSGPVGIHREAAALNQAGVKAVCYVSQDSGHDFTSWRRSLYYFAPLLFRAEAP
jgi:enterochelin esterase family protein